jgi:Lrp/AsnC family transcriptional regulator, leucine-responsive regulatory protein
MAEGRVIIDNFVDSKADMSKGLRSIGTDIDAVDVRLLRMLAANSRSSLAELARAVRMSAPSVAERLRRLEEAGVIRHYTIEVDPAALGLGLAASIRIRPMTGQLLEVAALLAELPEIVECDRVTGEDCFVAKAHVRSVQDLERVIDRIIPLAQTNTSIIQSSPVARRLPRLGEAE